MKKNPENFRTPRLLRAAMPLLAMTMCIAAGLCVRSEQVWWLSTGFIIFLIVALLATIEAWFARLEISESHLRIVKFLKTIEISRESFHSFSSAKGCHPVIDTTDGTRHELPDLNISPRALGNKLRAWAKRKYHEEPNKTLHPTARSRSVDQP